MKTLRTLLVDDEIPAQQRLLQLLAKEADVDVVGVCASGPQAIEAVRTLHPDLLFLDIQMPGCDGLEVVRTVGPTNMPTTIFVTAYDQYALSAFDLAALDYLLKPFDNQRFRETLDRAREHIRLRQLDTLHQQLIHLLHAAQRQPEATPPSEPELPATYLERLAVEHGGQVLVLAVERIAYITAEGPYVRLHSNGRTYLIRERMKVLETRLNPALFYRIHRSTIVNVTQIASYQRHMYGDYMVYLHDGTKLKLSRTRRDALVKHLGLGS